jgi:predicted nucleic acid-binding protein
MADLSFVYWDTSIWIAYFNPRKDANDARVPIAQKLMENIQNGSQIVVVSDLVKMEIVTVIRQRIIESQEYQGDADKIKDEIESVAKEETSKAMEFIRDLSVAHKAILFNLGIPASDLHGKTLDILQNCVFGEIKSMRKKCICPNCGEVKSPPKYNINFPAHYDIQHALIASTPLTKKISVKKIYAFDRGFRQLADLKEFKGIIDIEIPA